MSNEHAEQQLYNTLTRRKEPFVPRREGEVSIYVCGVTPYDDAHIGHARPSVFFDVVRRYMREMGWQVQLIQNFTDVDDKIIERAASSSVEPMELARTYADKYLRSMDNLGVERADAYPTVSGHIAEIVEMIEGLVDKGAAYAHEGNVFFSVDQFPDYGRLSNQRKEALVASDAVEAAEGKRSPLDFALWKATKPGEPSWDSPWGAGRPGWHIECSAMSLKYLGHGFDIHGGGLDLIFPHHENEIAQSEAYTGEKPFVRYWLHNGLINFGDEKMSKSLGNFITVDELLEQHPRELLRHALLHQHYRSPMEFDADHLDSVKRGWVRLNDMYHGLRSLGDPLPVEQARALGVEPSLIDSVEAAEAKFLTAMADDFNTPAALAALFELVRDVRPYMRNGDALDEKIQTGLRAAYFVLDRLGGRILGILTEEPIGDAPVDRGGADSRVVEGLIQILIEERAEARREKAWDRADRIRDALIALDIILTDTPEGTQWSFKE